MAGFYVCVHDGAGGQRFTTSIAAAFNVIFDRIFGECGWGSRAAGDTTGDASIHSDMVGKQ